MLKLDSKLNIRLLNIIIRGISMVSRFLLIIVLAKLLSPSDLGLFGLLVAGISFAVLLVGFDYYAYSNREILATKSEDYSIIIFNQIYAYVPLYLLFIPIAIFLSYYDFLPHGYFLWFFILMIVEHISLEQNRLLNTMQKQLSASIVLFLRSGIWVLFMLPIIVYVEKFRNLETVLYAWLIGGVASITFGTFIIKKSVENWSFIKPSYQWIIKGYKTGLFFILGTVAFRAISTVDRFWLEKISDSDIVGVYVFYTSLTVGVTAFIHAGVIVFSVPKLVRTFQEGELLKFKHLMNRFLKELLASILIMVSLMYLFMPIVIDWIGKPTYFDSYNVFYIILATAVLIVISSHPNTYLYAARRDKYTLFSNISAFIVFILMSIMFYFNYHEYSDIYKVAISVLVSFVWFVAIKYFGYFYYSKFTCSVSLKKDER